MIATDDEFILKDYTAVYQRIMQFDKNKNVAIHQWYPFVEGYSKEFIDSILEEISYQPTLALDPFAGSGTTPLELQARGIECFSFEVSPFMHLLATVKLESSYSTVKLNEAVEIAKQVLSSDLGKIRKLVPVPIAKTFKNNGSLEKWIFHDDVLDAILEIKYATSFLTDTTYINLFKISLASILLEVSNVYRDGKSVKYRSNWKNRSFTKTEVHSKFFYKLEQLILPDIKRLEQSEYLVNNKNHCRYGDVRTGMQNLVDHSIDLVITSPPYLNSRDYTDIYIVELWMLDLIKNYDELKSLRKKTFRSHVQVKRSEVELIEIDELKNVIQKLSEISTRPWNKGLPDMVKGYFKDMQILFRILKRKMQPNKKVYFNVANSAYYGIEIKVDEIISKIAKNEGFTIDEIRKARDLNPSSQQKDLVGKLRETVIVMTSPNLDAH